MVVIPGPVEFLMGSPPDGGRSGETYEMQHKKRIGRTFATRRQAGDDGAVPAVPDRSTTTTAQYYPTSDLPGDVATWYEAAAYCNWLSKQEGIPEDQWCYEIEEGQVTKAEEQQTIFSLTGYRLPTEAEMEYATRAGAVTSRYYGETEELLPKYAWYEKNSKEQTWPVGSLKPNDLGLFDMHGQRVDMVSREATRIIATVRQGEVVEDR